MMSKICWFTVLGLFTLYAEADTYNFHFNKPSEKSAQAEATPTPTPTPSPEAKLPEPSPTSMTQSSVGSPTPPLAATPVAAIELAPERRSPWRLGFSWLHLVQQGIYGEVSNGKLSTYKTGVDSDGGLLTLGYDISDAVGISAYAGGRKIAQGTEEIHLGVDIQFLPFRLTSGSTNVLELGLLAGFSNAMAAQGNLGTIHAGARLNIGFSQNFGITTVVRANSGYASLEAGLVTRL